MPRGARYEQHGVVGGRLGEQADVLPRQHERRLLNSRPLGVGCERWHWHDARECSVRSRRRPSGRRRGTRKVPAAVSRPRGGGRIGGWKTRRLSRGLQVGQATSVGRSRLQRGSCLLSRGRGTDGSGRPFGSLARFGVWWQTSRGFVHGAQRGTASVWLQVGKPRRATGSVWSATTTRGNGLESGARPRRRFGDAADDVKGATACGDVGHGYSRGEGSGG
jgi:hypothetical protein